MTTTNGERSGMPKNGLHKAGIAYREVHQWLQGATMTCTMCIEPGTVDVQSNPRKWLSRIVLWGSANISAPFSRISLPAEFRQYRDLEWQPQKSSA